MEMVFVPDGGPVEKSLSFGAESPDTLLRRLSNDVIRDVVRSAEASSDCNWLINRDQFMSVLARHCQAGRLLFLPRPSAAAPQDATATARPLASASKGGTSAQGNAAPTPEKKGKGRVPHRRPPKEVVDVDGINRPGSPKVVKLEKETAAAYARLVEHARRDGHAAPLFLIVSGYRDEKKQADLYAKALIKYGSAAEARKWVAPPGRSAHGTGCAVDLWLGYSCSKENNDKIKKTQAYKWLTTNANDHGFNPYELEGWHWEYYVGN